MGRASFGTAENSLRDFLEPSGNLYEQANKRDLRILRFPARACGPVAPARRRLRAAHAEGVRRPARPRAERWPARYEGRTAERRLVRELRGGGKSHLYRVR